ncbi:MAG: serine acetyltransferase [Cyanobacteria bacterium J06621_15]
MFNPSFLWWLSCQLYKRELVFLARIIKAIIFLVFHAVLPYEAEIEKDIELAHYGLGIVIHPNVKIGKRVKIYHNVTLATETWIGSPHKIIIEDGVVIGAGSAVVGRGDQMLTIGKGVRVGAGAVVTRNILAGQTVVGVPAKKLKY